MNNIFNIKRFGWVLGKDFQESWKRYLLQFMTMFGIILVVFCIYSSDIYKNVEKGSYLLKSVDMVLLGMSSVIFFAFGCIIASTLMEPMRNKTKRISFLTNPSSNFEKILSRWLIVTIGYIITFFIALWLADAVRVAIYSAKYPNLDVHFINFDKLISFNGNNHSEYTFFNPYLFLLCLSFYFLMQSLFILGATFWEKSTFVKTFSTGVVIFLLFLLVCNWTIKITYGDSGHFINIIDSFGIDKIENDKVFSLAISGFVLFALVNWVIAFFRFRESEIIKRW